MSSTPLPFSSYDKYADKPHASNEADDAEIKQLVVRFYERAREDAQLGPVFTEHVKDWDTHLAKMQRFWSSAVHRTGRYSGNPFAAHQPLSEINDSHFDRWLELWHAAVNEVVRPELREKFLDLASRMRFAMAVRLGLRSGKGPFELHLEFFQAESPEA